MAVILGIDLGTSSVKAMLLEENTGVIDVAARKYEVSIPRIGYAEQEPEMWWAALKEVLEVLRQRQKNAFEDIKAIGFSGQMHGLVMVDREGNSIRPAILWLDQRSQDQLKEIEGKISLSQMGNLFHNRVFTGFAFPSLLWVREEEPERFKKIYRILEPKDYIRMKMTGTFGSDMSDASATTIFHTGKREWSWEIIDSLALPREIFPECHESTEVAGETTRKCMEETGLPQGIQVIYGAGDQPAQSIGNGAIEEGLIISNIGTGGQISAYQKQDKYDSKLRTQTFCHAIDHAYTIYGATLCSGMSLNWLKNKILLVEEFDNLSTMAAEIAPASEGLIYLPYLSGERTPHMNPQASGMFFGLNLGHDRRHLARAVMEGVVFSLKDSLMIFDEMEIRADRIIASGGGAASPVWLQIQADVFEKEVKVCNVNEQACLGACILAGVGSRIFPDVKEACSRFVGFHDTVYVPIEKNISKYRQAYVTYRQLYSNTAQLMSD